MSAFSKYRYLYKEPERFTTDEARLNRIRSELKRLEVERVSLSPANKFHLTQLKEFQVKFGDELEARRRRVEQLNVHAQRDPSILRSASVKSAMSRYFQLLQRQNALRQRANTERRANVLQAAAVDRRHFNFGDWIEGRTIFGTLPYYAYGKNARRHFKHPLLQLPCIQRASRREVMFAKGHAGRGHKGKHRFNPLSLIGC